MSPPSSVSTTFRVEDAPGTSHNTSYAYWHPGTYYYPLSPPTGALPYGYPPPPVLAPAHPPAASMSAFPANPGAPASVEYTATPCPDCGQVIKVSNATTYHMDRHRESQRCKRQAVRNAMKDEQAKASALRTELFSNTPGRGQRGEGSASAVGAGAGGKGKGCAEDAGKVYCDIAVQADLVLPLTSVVRVQKGRKAHRRCHSEPPPDAFELQGTPLGIPDCRKLTVTCYSRLFLEVSARTIWSRACPASRRQG